MYPSTHDSATRNLPVLKPQICPAGADMRHSGQRPTFLKLGGREPYTLTDIEAFEQGQFQCAVKASDAIARVTRVPRRLTADPARSTGPFGAFRQHLRG